MELNIVKEKGESYVIISTKDQVVELLKRISEDSRFAYRFKFSDRELFIFLINQLDIDQKTFSTKNHFFDAVRKLHISESDFDYIWISTSGLVADNKPTTNSAVNSCLIQYTVISLLIEKAIEVTEDENIYDIHSYSYGLLSNLSPAIFHNTVFYIEVLCKAYLSLAGEEAPKTHKLSVIYSLTKKIMKDNRHDDTLFHATVLEPLYKTVEHINQIQGDFKEQFIKYDANSEDDTTILFDTFKLHEMRMLLEMSADFIRSYFDKGSKSYYLESNLYQRLLSKANSVEEKLKIQKLYPYLAQNNEKQS